MGFSITHILLLVIVIFVVFGAGKLPNVMGDLAKGVKQFKKGLAEDDEKPSDKDQNKAA